jgi:hypothetical protein
MALLRKLNERKVCFEALILQSCHCRKCSEAMPDLVDVSQAGRQAILIASFVVA